MEMAGNQLMISCLARLSEGWTEAHRWLILITRCGVFGGLWLFDFAIMQLTLGRWWMEHQKKSSKEEDGGQISSPKFFGSPEVSLLLVSLMLILPLLGLCLIALESRYRRHADLLLRATVSSDVKNDDTPKDRDVERLSNSKCGCVLLVVVMIVGLILLYIAIACVMGLVVLPHKYRTRVFLAFFLVQPSVALLVYSIWCFVETLLGECGYGNVFNALWSAVSGDRGSLMTMTF